MINIASNNIFQGLLTALITPFKNNKLDLVSLEKILTYQIDNKVDGIVVAGSTGEGTSLTLEEYERLVQTAVEITSKRLPIIAGCSASNTNAALEIIRIGTKSAVDGFMCSIPAYIKPTQEGVYLHFEALHQVTEVPIMLYSVPSRTIVDFSDDTIIQLSKLPRIIALKDASNDLERFLRIKPQIKDGFNLLAGNDGTLLSYNAQGGVGCVSVAANIVPALCKQIQVSCQNNDYHTALKIHQQLSPLYQALSRESNPIPVKYGVASLGLCANELRLPLTSATETTKGQVQKAMDLLLSLTYCP